MPLNIHDDIVASWRNRMSSPCAVGKITFSNINLRVTLKFEFFPLNLQLLSCMNESKKIILVLLKMSFKKGRRGEKLFSLPVKITLAQQKHVNSTWIFLKFLSFLDARIWNHWQIICYLDSVKNKPRCDGGPNFWSFISHHCNMQNYYILIFLPWIILQLSMTIHVN